MSTLRAAVTSHGTSHATPFAFGPTLLFCQLSAVRSEDLKIVSNPPGATVELNGVVAGTTPFEKSFPGRLFSSRTHTAFGQRLEHPMVARVSMNGYATHEIALTEGPMEWIDLHGHNHGQYWVFKAAEFRVTWIWWDPPLPVR